MAMAMDMDMDTVMATVAIVKKRKRMKKVDFHIHALPGVDDGARSPEMAIQMLQQLKAQQVEHAVLTPHYYSQREPLDHFLDRREEACVQLERAVMSPGSLPKLHLGCEVHLTDFLFNNRDLRPLCIDNGDVMLVELPFDIRRLDDVIDDVARLASDYLITPVLAHVERYPLLVRSEKALIRLLDIGCVLQMNVESFTMRGRRKLIKWASKGYVGALGTDAHNMTTRAPDYDGGLRALIDGAGRGCAAEIEETMGSLLRF
ncbi:MAG: hypothetical protein IJU16_03485, partial [Clostridia bacterium]|nr:hypothetical protein [Clostridia bacterium]